MIKGYNPGDNISLLNVIYHRPRKDPETEKYDHGSIDIIYKDLDTGLKAVQHIDDPDYVYYKAKEGVPVQYNRLFIDEDDVEPIKCKYRELKKSIAEQTGNLTFYYDNIRDGNYKRNQELFKLPSIFNADMNIEDFYRYMFTTLYKNDSYVPTKMYFDIEVDTKPINGRFPEPGECPVNAITLIDQSNKVIYTLLLDDPNNPEIAKFKQRENVPKEIAEFVRERVGGWKNEKRFGLDGFKYKVLFYKEEIMLIHDMFKIVNVVKPDFAMAWNIAFDLPYLLARIYSLGYDPRDIVCHPDFKVKEAYYYTDLKTKVREERCDYAQISCYTVYVDQLITFASIRKGQRKYQSYKLNDIGQSVAKVSKLQYKGSLMNLPYTDYHTFVFYNIMDTIVQLCIESKVNDIDFLLNRTLTMCTRISKGHRQSRYLHNRGILEFKKMHYIMGCNINISNQKEGYSGAYVADPLLVSDKPKIKLNGVPINCCNNLVDFDFKSLYPSIIAQNNIAPNTQFGKIFIEACIHRENRFNVDAYDRSAYFAEDYNSRNVISFANRWLGLGTYEEVHDDIIEYYSKVKNSARGGARLFDLETGYTNICSEVVNHEPITIISFVTPENKMQDILTVITRKE